MVIWQHRSTPERTGQGEEMCAWEGIEPDSSTSLPLLWLIIRWSKKGTLRWDLLTLSIMTMLFHNTYCSRYSFSTMLHRVFMTSEHNKVHLYLRFILGSLQLFTVHSQVAEAFQHIQAALCCVFGHWNNQLLPNCDWVYAVTFQSVSFHGCWSALCLFYKLSWSTLCNHLSLLADKQITGIPLLVQSGKDLPDVFVIFYAGATWHPAMAAFPLTQFPHLPLHLVS